MSPTEFGVNFFVAMFALIDPIGNVPMFAAATGGASGAGRRWVALYIAIFAFAVLAVFYLTGLRLLEFFGISLPAFRIAGGILLLLGRVGMTVIVRVAGLILCAMAVQFLIIGMNDATHGLVRASVAAPYADKAGR